MEEQDQKKQNVFLDGMMGLVVGDACGVPVEFMSRESLKRQPVTGMREYGTHHQPKGTWSDDSSMALANLVSLRQGYRLGDIADQFSRWLKNGEYTPFGVVFDAGNTCVRAIRNYQNSGDPYTCGGNGDWDNGNGSLMRILPMCIYVDEMVRNGNCTEEDAIRMVHEVSALTHAHLRSKMACGLYYFCVKGILNGRAEKTILQCLQSGLEDGFSYYRMDQGNETELRRYNRLSDLEKLKQTKEKEIKSSGYVVDTFEAAIWSLLQGEDFASAVLQAVNLGSDTDTVGAVAGGLAGLYYGYEGIPKEWRECIVQKERIEELCLPFVNMS